MIDQLGISKGVGLVRQCPKCGLKIRRTERQDGERSFVYECCPRYHWLFGRGHYQRYGFVAV
jgi:hypothetical protein